MPPKEVTEELRQAATNKDPDNDGDDDTTAEGDTDNSHFDAQGKKKPGMFDADGNPLAKKATEAQSFAELKAELEAERAARIASEEASVKAGERIAKLEKEGRTKRFSDTIRDSEGGGTKRFIGDESKHLEFLEKLSTAFGETSDEVKHYVTEQQAHAEQVRASSLFKEVGRTGGGENDALAQLDVKAKALQAAESIPYAVAYDRVMASEPELYRQSLKEGK